MRGKGLECAAMSRSRLDNLDPEKQRALFSAVAEEFAANGFDGASLNRILEKSGMGKSTLYYYFDDKADLFTTMVERAMGLLFGQIGKFDPDSLTAESFWPEIEAYYAKAIAAMNPHDWIVRFGHIFYSLRGHKRSDASTDRVFASARRWAGRLVERGQELGAVRSDIPHELAVELAMGLFETLDRWVLANWSTMTAKQRAGLAGEHIQLFQNLLAPVG